MAKKTADYHGWGWVVDGELRLYSNGSPLAWAGKRRPPRSATRWAEEMSPGGEWKKVRVILVEDEERET